MRKLALSVLCLILFVGISYSAQTQAISKKTETKPIEKFALGYSQIPVPGTNNTNSNNVPSFAGRYWFNEKTGIDVTLGFQTGDGDDIFLLGGKFLAKIYNVKNLDIYCLGGIQFGSVTVNNGVGNSSETALRLMGGVGAEYYILPCLSILTEVGLCFEIINSDPSVSQFKVFADWIPQAGVRFYFSKI